MKKLFLMSAFALGAFAMVVQVSTPKKAAAVVVTAPDMPPPDCFPDCPPIR
jgi:hypothetical protein